MSDKAYQKKKRLKLKADKMWRDNYVGEFCEICRGAWKVTGHHFYYKGSYAHLRYEKDNCISLCAKCHFALHHQDPKTVTEKIIEIRGQEWHERIKSKSQERPKSGFLTLAYYQSKVEELSC